MTTVHMALECNVRFGCDSRLENSPGLFGRGGCSRNVNCWSADCWKKTELSAAAVASASGGDSIDPVPFNPGPGITFGSSGLKLNIFGMYYTALAIFLGLFWWAGLTLCQILYKIFGERFDKRRRMAITTGHIWGKILLSLTYCYPIIEGRENLAELTKANEGKKGGEKKPAMFVANHSSWMDIPFVAMALGWTNYKMIAKQELLKVPVLSKSLRVSGHVVLDRSSRKSQMATYKTGVRWLKNGVHLITFPEGTRSRTGRLGPFKKGAFKMAQAVGAPIVPLSVSYAHKVQPLDYIFPVRPSRSIPAKVHIGKPISTEGKSDDEVMEEIWDAIAYNLPESQKPEPGTPVSVSK